MIVHNLIVNIQHSGLYEVQEIHELEERPSQDYEEVTKCIVPGQPNQHSWSPPRSGIPPLLDEAPRRDLDAIYENANGLILLDTASWRRRAAHDRARKLISRLIETVTALELGIQVQQGIISDTRGQLAEVLLKLAASEAERAADRLKLAALQLEAANAARTISNMNIAAALNLERLARMQAKYERVERRVRGRHQC